MRALVTLLLCALAAACQEDPGVIVGIDDDGGFYRHDGGVDRDATVVFPVRDGGDRSP